MNKLIEAIVKFIDSEREGIYNQGKADGYAEGHREGSASGFEEGKAAVMAGLAAARREDEKDGLSMWFGEAVSIDKLMEEK